MFIVYSGRFEGTGGRESRRGESRSRWGLISELSFTTEPQREGHTTRVVQPLNSKQPARVRTPTRHEPKHGPRPVGWFRGIWRWESTLFAMIFKTIVKNLGNGLDSVIRGTNDRPSTTSLQKVIGTPYVVSRHLRNVFGHSLSERVRSGLHFREWIEHTKPAFIGVTSALPSIHAPVSIP